MDFGLYYNMIKIWLINLYKKVYEKAKPWLKQLIEDIKAKNPFGRKEWPLP